jgi:hypothetical protein
MDTASYEELKRAIERRSNSLKNPPRKNQTNRSQTEQELRTLRSERKRIVKEYLVTENYAESYNSADVMFETMSEKWISQILEATPATRATVRGIPKVPGAAQKLRAREDRREDALKRAEERRAEREREREYARERRENPQILKIEAQKRTLASRMERAAQRLGIE